MTEVTRFSGLAMSLSPFIFDWEYNTRAGLWGAHTLNGRVRVDDDRLALWRDTGGMLRAVSNCCELGAGLGVMVGIFFGSGCGWASGGYLICPVPP
ncbi:hypothetical protein D3C80_1675510 [compost metagenome]